MIGERAVSASLPVRNVYDGAVELGGENLRWNNCALLERSPLRTKEGDLGGGMSTWVALRLLRSGTGSSLFGPQLLWNVQLRASHWQSTLLGLRTALPMRAEPPKKKKRVDPKREQAQKDRLKKKIKKLEKAAQELVPIEDFITPFRFMDEKRVREVVPLSFEESERRALLLKRWAAYRHKQEKGEVNTIKTLVAAQEQALKELRLESEELYQAALQRDYALFPFERQEPMHSPPLENYEAPEGKCSDITRIYTY